MNKHTNFLVHFSTNIPEWSAWLHNISMLTAIWIWFGDMLLSCKKIVLQQEIPFKTIIFNLSMWKWNLVLALIISDDSGLIQGRDIYTGSCKILSLW